MNGFQNRREAGKDLTQKLLKYANRTDVIILALPRGGVPVAYEVALALKVPLDVLIVRKLGLPGREELAIGAIASGGIQILNEDIIRAVGLDEAAIRRVVEHESRELQRREQQYRGNRPAAEIHEHVVILIDDGLATGASMLAAVRAVRTQGPARTIVAVPTAAPQAVELLQPEADEVISVIAPDPFDGVGRWYADFSQTTDHEVLSLLEDANHKLMR